MPLDQKAVSDDRPEFSEIVESVEQTFRALLVRAYDAGRAAGHREASMAMKAKLAEVFDLQEVAAPSAASDAGTVPPTTGSAAGELKITSAATGRAAPGSVKPVILLAVRSVPGMTTEQIQERTGIKHNSVRGTLWTLSAEGLVERREGAWFPVQRQEEAASMHSDAPSAEYQQSPAAAVKPADDEKETATTAKAVAVS